jgi:cholinesterase
MTLLRRFLPICLLLAAAVSASAAGPFDRLYVFGDSYSDSGAGYVDGDGPTAVVFLGEKLGLKLLPATQAAGPESSLNFAVSGAQTGSGEGGKVKDALLGRGMRTQVDDFAARVRAKSAVFQPASTLFFLAGGLNDRRLPGQTTVDNLKGEIRSLYELGGRNFLLALLPTAIPSFSEVGKRLNPEIERVRKEMAAELPEARIDLSRWGLYMDEVIQEPAKFGIRNITDKCAGRAIFDEDPTPCATPEAYFFYHGGHPSMAVHKIVGARLYAEALALR